MVARRCGIRHLSKAAQDRAIYRGLGSIDFAAAARSILLAGQDPRDQQRRVLAHAKSSLAPIGASLAYELAEGLFLWAGKSPLMAKYLLRPQMPDEERSAIDEARDWLRAMLADGPQPEKDIIKGPDMAGSRHAENVAMVTGQGRWHHGMLFRLLQAFEVDDRTRGTQHLLE